MTIEIHEPELEQLIQSRMRSGHFASVEDVLLQALRSSSDSENALPKGAPKLNFAQFLMQSPLPASGLEIGRIQDYPYPAEL